MSSEQNSWWDPDEPDLTQVDHNITGSYGAHWSAGQQEPCAAPITAELAWEAGASGGITTDLPWDARLTGTFDLPIRAALESGQHTRTDASLWTAGRVRDEADHDASALIGSVVGDRYRLVSVLGRGGMSTVYRAEHVGLGVPVAVKVLGRRLSESPAHVEQFLCEARTTAMIRHPNVIDVLDVGFLADGARPFLVLELLEGEDLQTILHRERALPWPRARALMLQICAALDAAHRRGVIHRDIKPHNCFVVRSDGAEDGAFAPDDGVDRVVLLDFGIAKLTAVSEPGALTSQGDTFGTVEYLSPERALDLPIDRRSDIYSLGVVLYRMLTGYVPFYSADALTVARAHVSQPPQPPRVIAPDATIPSELDDIVLRALAKDPDDRFQTAGELAAALRAIPTPPAKAPRLAPAVRRAEISAAIESALREVDAQPEHAPAQVHAHADGAEGCAAIAADADVVPAAGRAGWWRGVVVAVVAVAVVAVAVAAWALLA